MELVRGLESSVDVLKGGPGSIKKSISRKDERPIHNSKFDGRQQNLRKVKSNNKHQDVEIRTPGQNYMNDGREGPASNDSDRFGGLKPFEHHALPNECIQYDSQGNIINPLNNFGGENPNFGQPGGYSGGNDGYSGGYSGADYSGRGGRQPYQQQMPQQPYYKDPAVWDEPSPPRRNTKPKTKAAPPPKRRVRPTKQSSNSTSTKPSTAKSDGKRAYDKPWLPPPKKEKKKADTFLEHCYPDCEGPDADLIKMLERDVVTKNPSVSFDDIAELDDAKRILQEAVVLPLLMPDYFRGLRRPWKGV